MTVTQTGSQFLNSLLPSQNAAVLAFHLCFDNYLYCTSDTDDVSKLFSSSSLCLFYFLKGHFGKCFSSWILDIKTTFLVVTVKGLVPASQMDVLCATGQHAVTLPGFLAVESHVPDQLRLKRNWHFCFSVHRAVTTSKATCRKSQRNPGQLHWEPLSWQYRYLQVFHRSLLYPGESPAVPSKVSFCF